MSARRTSSVQPGEKSLQIDLIFLHGDVVSRSVSASPRQVV